MTRHWSRLRLSGLNNAAIDNQVIPHIELNSCVNNRRVDREDKTSLIHDVFIITIFNKADRKGGCLRERSPFFYGRFHSLTHYPDDKITRRPVKFNTAKCNASDPELSPGNGKTITLSNIILVLTVY